MTHYIDISTLHRRNSTEPAVPYKPNRKVGRKSFRPFIIATRPLTGEWPAPASSVIEQARKGYDRGTHMMCHGMDRGAGVVILYSWKRRHPVAPINYFNEENQNG